LKPTDYKNIIFDFGGVIINIDPMLTVKAFANLSPELTEEKTMKVIQDPLFRQFEKGKISESELRTGITNMLDINTHLSNMDFDEAWDAMILDLPIARLDLIQSLKNNHRLFLLSNTNSIHMRKVSKIVKQTIQKDSIDHFFEKAYYSHLVGMRKPDREIFDFVLKENNLIPDETIFLDDFPINFPGAVEAGIATLEVDRDILQILA